MNCNLIQCGDHQWAPWHIVCIHLLMGESRDWMPVGVSDDDGREIDHDWLCPACTEKHEEIMERGGDYTQAEMEPLRPVCMHCVRNIRKKFDANYNEEDI